MQVGFHVQSELLLARSFYMRKIKVFCEKYVSYSVTSPSCSFGCECMRSYCDGEYSSETKTVTDRTLKVPLPLS